MTKDALLGEGSFSVCRRGSCLTDGSAVAIKVYKQNVSNTKIMPKFKRQIEVLQELMSPIEINMSAELRHAELLKTPTNKLFMMMLDFSQGVDGTPGMDPAHHMFYVVTELAKCTLKDLFQRKLSRKEVYSDESVRSMAKAILFAVAGLHAKGLVHFDLKPANIMLFGDRLKVIDVDGCCKVGQSIRASDSSSPVAFTLCYSSPQWAKFMLSEDGVVFADTAFDVWSVGMILCELVTLESLLKPNLANCLRNATSAQEANFLFMEWLSHVRKPPVPKKVRQFEPNFGALIVDSLLAIQPEKRKSCATCLMHSYFNAYSDITVRCDPEQAKAERRFRPEDDSGNAPRHQGTLWKLKSGGSPSDLLSWDKRDMWIASNYSLCYFSIKEGKRLVLIDGPTLMTAQLRHVDGLAKPYAFEVVVSYDTEGMDTSTFTLACDSVEQRAAWMAKLQHNAFVEMSRTMRLDAKTTDALNTFKLAVKNRRIKVSENDLDNYEAVFKDSLWKVKAGGQKDREEDWYLREMWIAKNGSLVYFSTKEQRPLVYYTFADIASATFEIIPDEDSCKPYCFQVKLESANNVVFAPGEFAATSEEMRTRWMGEFMKFMHLTM
eukprot:TRINITY_DN29177_c0_g1_i2.p1 TRINITY_DN29177_c0_g1~~TRINITY_DN29177_c0_g1_i2.p1  ORF type:complete len:655 (+),score=61.42 TRINITY_DN29177_c0_g1_i2:150-1967(+)